MIYYIFIRNKTKKIRYLVIIFNLFIFLKKTQYTEVRELKKRILYFLKSGILELF